MRKAVDDFLNKLEQEILDDLETKQSQLKSKMKSILQQLKAEANNISKLQSEFSKMTQYATELQMYAGLRDIEKTTSQAAKYIEDLKSGGSLDEVNLELTISSELQTILKGVKSFGDININTRPFTLQLKAGRKDQAQYLVPTIPTIEQIKPSFLKQLTIPREMKTIHIHSCIILPDGKYLIVDSGPSESNLLMFSNEGMFMREVVKFTRYTPDTCFVRNNMVAVALGFKNQTALVDVKKNKIVKSIKLTRNCNSVASDGQILVIGSMDKITIVNLSDMSQTILEGLVADSAALFKGNIYASFHGYANKVYCYTHTGEALWTFVHDATMSKHSALTLDKNGFVYILSESNNRVVVISPDGKTCKTILSEADGIKPLCAIDIDRETGIMIVSSILSDDINDDKSFETAFVYKI